MKRERLRVGSGNSRAGIHLAIITILTAWAGTAARVAVADGSGASRTHALVRIVPPDSAAVETVVAVTSIGPGGEIGGIARIGDRRVGFVDGLDAAEGWRVIAADDRFEAGVRAVGGVGRSAVNFEKRDGTPVQGELRRRTRTVSRVRGAWVDLADDGTALGVLRNGTPFIQASDGRTRRALPGLPGATRVTATALSDRTGRFVVGMSDDAGSAVLRPVVWTPGGEVVELTLGEAAADSLGVVEVTEEGVVAGWVDEGAGGLTPVLWGPLRDGSRWRGRRGPAGVGLPRDCTSAGEVLLADSLWIPDSPVLERRFLPLAESSNRPRGLPEGTRLEAEAMNEDGLVAARLVRPDGTAEAVRLVPLDLDNDREPDYRRIAFAGAGGDDPDLDGDWMLDRATVLRCGFFNVIEESVVLDQAARPMRIVRLIRGLHEIEAARHDPERRRRLDEAVDFWGHERRCEIIVTVRSPRRRDDGTYHERHDGIPDPEEARRWRETLEWFGERYARHIDFVQLGNEIFGGAGQYWIDADRVSCLGGRGAVVKEIPAECIAEAHDAVFAWLEVQADAIRLGSARSGRPLRIIAPAINRRHVTQGALGDPEDFDHMRPPTDFRQSLRDVRNRASFVTLTTFEFAADVCDAADMHGRYHLASVELLEALRLVGSPGTPWGARGVHPPAFGMTEFAPMPLREPETAGSTSAPDEGPTWFQLHTLPPDEGGVPPTLETYVAGHDGPLPPPEWTWEELLED